MDRASSPKTRATGNHVFGVSKMAAVIHPVRSDTTGNNIFLTLVWLFFHRNFKNKIL